MGSVIDFMTCPRCNVEQALYTDYDYNTGEESALCIECGYNRDHYIKRDADGKALFTVVDGVKQYEWGNFENPEPYGVVNMNHAEGFGSLHILKDEEAYNVFKHNIADQAGIEIAIFSRLSDSKIVKEVLVDNTTPVSNS